MRIISLLPAATEIAGALGLTEQVVGVSHECDFPEEANERPRVTHCPIHNAGLTSHEVDAWVRRALRENGTIYSIDEALLRDLRPDVILTQKLCDVCAVGYGTVAKLAQTLPGPPRVVNLEPTSLADIFDDIRRVAETCDIPERAQELIRNLSAEVEWQHVLDACPEVIVLALCGYDISRARCDYELLVKFPGFDSIPAVRSGEIYVVNASAYFSRPGPRIVDSLEILAGILHPNEFSEFVSRGSDDLRVVCMSQGARTELYRGSKADSRPA